jgi:hypothetical protein
MNHLLQPIFPSKEDKKNKDKDKKPVKLASFDNPKQVDSIDFSEDKDMKNKKNKAKPKMQHNVDKIEYDNLNIEKVETSKNKLAQRKLMKANIIPQHPGVSLMIGSVNSGKTNFLINLLTRPQFYGPSNELTKEFKPYFDVVFLLTGSQDDAYDVLIEKGILKEQHINYNPQPEDIQAILDIQGSTIKKNGLLKAPKVLIILEDIVDNQKLMRSTPFRSLFIKPRQNSFSIFICAQYINLIPKGLRQQAINLFIFPQNRAGDDIICDQFCPGHMKKDEFMHVISQCTEVRDKESHPFMHINRRCKTGERFRRNLNKIIEL